MLKHLFVFWLSNTKYSTLELIFDSNVIFPNLTTSTKIALTSFSTIIAQEKSTNIVHAVGKVMSIFIKEEKKKK